MNISLALSVALPCHGQKSSSLGFHVMQNYDEQKELKVKVKLRFSVPSAWIAEMEPT